MARRVEDFGFEAEADYHTELFVRADGKPGRRRKDYHLTLDMAKELAMVERTAIGRATRRLACGLGRTLGYPNRFQARRRLACGLERTLGYPNRFRPGWDMMAGPINDPEWPDAGRRLRLLFDAPSTEIIVL